MSASSKKKLRKEQNAAKMTERQRQAQAESKKLKLYSTVFMVIFAAVIVTALVILGVTGFNRLGIIERNTVAATIDGVELNSAEMSYYYIDAITNTVEELQTNYGSDLSMYASIMGLQMNTPLDEQFFDEEKKITWADHFYEVALEDARSMYALEKAAKAEGFTLSEVEKAVIDASIEQTRVYMKMAGYNSLNRFLAATYGNGVTEASYRAYIERAILAGNYYNAHRSELSYTEDQLREHEKDNEKKYNAYDYGAYYLTYSNFLEGGTKNENGGTVYSEEERNAARQKAKEAAEALAKHTTMEEINKAIAELPFNEGKEDVKMSSLEGILYDEISTYNQEWLTDESRKPGDVTVIPITSTTTDADGKETTVENGQYVLFFVGSSENKRPVGNVRHLLVAFESATGSDTFTDAEKEAAKTEAETIYNEWKSGAATQESFIELVKEKTDDTASISTGGLYENIIPNDPSYVAEFADWAADESREEGDTEIVETEYGYHIMYYVGDSELNYRDYMISEELRETDTTAWHKALVDAVKVEKGDLSRLALDKIMANMVTI